VRGALRQPQDPKVRKRERALRQAQGPKVREENSNSSANGAEATSRTDLYKVERASGLKTLIKMIKPEVCGDKGT